MDYISVKEAAQKFNLSERRVQKLCETQRIDGCSMVSGIWLIPANAMKPSPERLPDVSPFPNCLTLKELCSELSISVATGRNWIRLGKLKPCYTENQTPFFPKDYVNCLHAKLQSAENHALKTRRNKKYVSGNRLYHSYVSDKCQNIPAIHKLLSLVHTDTKQSQLNSPIIQLLLADCALHLFTQKYGQTLSKCTDLLLHFLQGEFSIGEYDELINALVENKEFAIDFCQTHPLLFSIKYIYEPNEDILGLIYISCKNIGNRKATGSYYTPTQVVKKLINTLNIQHSQRILDPCCGTGNFLLQLPDNIAFDSIYGNDIDSTSVKITRLNMALKHNVPCHVIYEHITELNYLTEFTSTNFQHIIGNPPWGFEFSPQEKSLLKKKFKSASENRLESYDIFIEQSIRQLSEAGHLAFILPEAILNVKSHIKIREIILQNYSISNLEFLGNTFDGVQCPCILLDMKYSPSGFSTVGMNVNLGTTSFTMNTQRNVSANCFSFTACDEEYNVLKKIRNNNNVSFLQGNADFALGIVTGNNKEYISDVKTEENELILKGADICKYHINPTNNYIVFKPDSFQQIAPTEMYRAKEKLLYRFISNQLVFAYDDKQTLSLNSCNIVIPKLPGIKIKYVLAILNSRIAQFIYKRQFNSIKVLRSHIENIPIPLVDDATQDNIISITDKLIAGLNINEAETVYDELDTLIATLFHLSFTDINIIKKAVDGDNKFL